MTAPEETVEESEEAPSDSEDTQPEPSLDDLLSKPEVREKLSSELFQSEEFKQQLEIAENRGRQKTLVEQRRKFADPQAVTEALTSIARDLGEGGELSQSVKVRAEQLFAANKDALADLYITEIREAFFEDIETPDSAKAEYGKLASEGDYDGAIKALINGAVAHLDQKREQGFETRVKAEVEKRVKAELDGQNEDSATPPPAPRGGSTRNGLMLTTADIQSSTWNSIRSRLPQNVRDQVYANVTRADERYGSDKHDANRVAALESLIA